MNKTTIIKSRIINTPLGISQDKIMDDRCYVFTKNGIKMIKVNNGRKKAKKKKSRT